MALECEFSIIYFTLIVHGSMSIVINRNVCLETVTRFLNHEDECDFNSNTTEDILQNDTTCPNKCNFMIYNLHSGGRYSLENISLTIGNNITMFNPCSGSYRHNKSLFINCSSWNAREYIIRDDVDDCFINDSQCARIYNYCICHCLPGYILEDKTCLKLRVNIGGICEHNWQCNGTEFANVCNDGLCVCNSGYIQIDRKCYQGNQELNDSCELTEQCIQPFSDCYQEKCTCMNGYSAFDTDSCLKASVNIGGICEHTWQCKGTEFANVCDDGSCVCSSGYIQRDRKCYQGNITLNDPCEFSEQCMQPFSVCYQEKCTCMNGYSAFDTDSCLKDTNIGVTLGTLFGGLILGLIVTAVVTTLMYRRFKFPTRKRQEPDVIFADNRTNGAASGGQTSFSNDTKQKVATVSLYSFSKETPGYKKQENGRTEDVYNHLHEQTEQDDDTYDHVCVAPNHSGML